MKSIIKTVSEFDYIMQEVKAITQDDIVVKKIMKRAEQTARTTTMSLPQAISFEANRYLNQQSNQTVQK